MKSQIYFLFVLINLLFSQRLIAQENYFQQEVNTTIHVTLNDKQNTLSAFETFEYINNSPDTLKKIYIHLWPNAYKNNSSEMAIQSDENGDLDFHFADSINRGFIDSLDFKVEEQKVIMNYLPTNEDICVLELNKPLLPGNKIIVSTPFRVKIPLGIYSRLGHIGESFQITQWFPKPAVYDKNGWHPLPYLSQGEFYSEYGSYDVYITLPENYVVGATGDLVDCPNEIEFLNRKVAETEVKIKNNNLVKLNKAGRPIMDFPESSETLKTLHYHQENIHDFAWFADKRYHVLKGEVKLPNSDETVTTWAMFTNGEAKLWKDAIPYLDSAIYYYSLWTGNYPYKQATAVDGSISAGGGMEYPNVTVIGTSYTAKALEQVIVHEVGHNWFYGLLGSNERVHAWMDEGLNSFMENRYFEQRYPNDKIDFGLPPKINKKLGLDEYGNRGLFDLGYVFNARRNYDQAIETPSQLFTPTNYGAIVYGKTAIGFDYLKAYLGDDLFDQCMHKYYDIWHFKHPQPEDIRKIFEEVSGKDLSWLFDDFIKTTKKIDYAFIKIKKTENGYDLTLKNTAQIKSPVSVYGISGNSTKLIEWVEGFNGEKTISISGNYDKFILDDPMDIPMLKRTDDIIETKGMFKKVEPIKLEFLGSLEKRDRTSLFYLPLLGYNYYDGVMPGIALYNSTFPEKKFSYVLLPMFSTKQKTISGMGELSYKIFNNKIFRRITLFSKAQSFGLDYFKYSSRNGEFHKNELTKQWTIKTGFEMEIYRPLRKKSQHYVGYRAVVNNEYSSSINIGTNVYHELKYTLKNKQFLKPGSIEVKAIYGNPTYASNFSLIQTTISKRINYNKDLKGITFRLFGGYMLQSSNTGRYNFNLSGQNGNRDYMYDNVFLGRNTQIPNILGQQSMLNQGAFISSTNFPISTNTWMVTANVKADLPVSPVKLFADLGFYPTISNGKNTVKTAYDAGAYLSIGKGLFEIYFPMIYSDEFKNNFNFYNVNYFQRIRFVININKINPYHILKDVAP